jgi:hypothetical protein
MMGGMALGAEAALKWAGPMHPHQFLLAYIGMSAGMALGMTFACAAGEAAVSALGRRD